MIRKLNDRREDHAVHDQRTALLGLGVKRTHPITLAILDELDWPTPDELADIRAMRDFHSYWRPVSYYNWRE